MSDNEEMFDRDDEQRFRITSPIEILSELRSVMAQRALLTLSFGADGECALSSLLEVNAAQQSLILDACQNPLVARKVMAASGLRLETEVRRIRMRFDSGRAVSDTYEGQPAMRIAMPASMVRIQRREAYRIDTPANEVVSCRFKHPTLAHREIVLRVADLSIKGMGITADHGLWPAEPGTMIKECRIDLPEMGVVHCDARIVRVLDKDRPGKHRLWIGCQFLQINGPSTTLLQKYILGLERARMARSRGIEATPAYS